MKARCGHSIRVRRSIYCQCFHILLLLLLASALGVSLKLTLALLQRWCGVASFLHLMLGGMCLLPPPLIIANRKASELCVVLSSTYFCLFGFPVRLVGDLVMVGVRVSNLQSGFI